MTWPLRWVVKVEKLSVTLTKEEKNEPSLQQVTIV